MEATGRIFARKRFAVHDGPGIRTTVFFKGCPLRCRWCHNPEGLSAAPQLAFYASKCLHCGECIPACPSGAREMNEDGPRTIPGRCTACGMCANVCPGQALTLYGREVTVQELLPQLCEDRLFYAHSGGGITLSGGECLLQAPFCRALLAQCKTQGLHTAVDTCGAVPWDAFAAVLPYTDLFLYDIKAVDDDVHLACTGQKAGPILRNLRRLTESGARVEIRYPYVPGCNDGQTKKIAAFVATLPEPPPVRVLPYHDYARSKYRALGLTEALPPTLPTSQDVQQVEALFATKG